MNLLAYIIYLVITYIITVHVGFYFYKNGYIYIQNLVKDEAVTISINRLLLLGYYLLNLGYTAFMMQQWQTIIDINQLLEMIFIKIGIIIIGLALMHYCNMTIIYVATKYSNFFNHNKTKNK